MKEEFKKLSDAITGATDAFGELGVQLVRCGIEMKHPKASGKKLAFLRREYMRTQKEMRPMCVAT